MTAVLSTSSPLVSVALFDKSGALLCSRELLSKNNASGAALTSLLQLLESVGAKLSSIDRLVADLGPGSFTGSKVAVTIVKTFAMSLGCQACGVSSFDLIDCGSTVVVPSRKDVYFVREPGSETTMTKSVPKGAKGYGPPGWSVLYPHAKNFCKGCTVTGGPPEALVPLYIAPPSISLPKDPRTLRGSSA